MKNCGSSDKLISMMFLTTSYMVVELVVGNITNSMALVADSFHMLSDVIALVIALVSVRLSKKKCDSNTFGWARAEVVGALVNAVFLFALCFSITVQAIKRFLVLEKIEDPKMILIVGGVGLLINIIGMVIFGHSHGDDDHSNSSEHNHDISKETKDSKIASGAQMNIQGVFLHLLADALGSVVVLISASVIWLTDWEYKDYLDPLLSLLIVILICISTWPLFRESIMILLNSTPAHIDTTQLKSGLMSTIPVIRNVHELHIWQLVGRRIIVTGHVEVEPTDKGFLSHEYHFLIGKQIKDYFHDLGIHSTTIQIEYSIGAKRMMEGWTDRLSDISDSKITFATDIVRSGECGLMCPADPRTGHLDTACNTDSCCQTMTKKTYCNLGLLEDGSVEIMSKL